MNRLLNDWKIQNKLVVAVVVVFLVGVVAMTWTIANVNEIRERTGNIVTTADELLYLVQIEAIFRELEAVEKDMLLDGEPIYVQNYIDSFRTNQALLEQYMRELAGLTTDRDIERLLAALRRAAEQWETEFFALSALMTSDLTAAQQLSASYSEGRIAAIYTPLIEMVEGLDERGGRITGLYTSLESVTTQTNATITTGWVMVGVFGLIGLVIVAAVVFVARNLVKPIITIADATVGLERGEYDVESLDPISQRRDEIGELAGLFVKMVGNVRQREDQLKAQVAQMQIVIDEEKKAKQVAEITETDYFRTLQARSKEMRARRSAEIQSIVSTVTSPADDERLNEG